MFMARNFLTSGTDPIFQVLFISASGPHGVYLDGNMGFVRPSLPALPGAEWIALAKIVQLRVSELIVQESASQPGHSRH